MIPRVPPDSVNSREENLHLRDWILLPLVGLLTTCLILVSSELIARRMFYQSTAVNATCFEMFRPASGMGVTPNSVCWAKSPESKWVEYRFDSSGFRAGIEIGPKPPGTYRIVLIGSSAVMGYAVSREQSFAALLPVGLSRQTGRKIEVYNEGLTSGHPEVISRWFNQVLDANPDLILWGVSAHDVELGLEDQASPRAPDIRQVPDGSGLLATARTLLKEKLATKSFPDAIRVVLNMSRTIFMLRHFFYKSQDLYLKAYVKGDEAGFLDTELNSGWQSNLQGFSRYSIDITTKARAANVPIVVFLVPAHAQADMISRNEWPTGIDPYKLDDELRSLITAHGGIYIDLLPHFRNILDTDSYFFSVDDHPNVGGHALLSGFLASELTSGVVPALDAATPTQAALQ